MKKVTRQEAQTLLAEIGHESNITVPVTDKVTGDIEYKSVLNKAMVYNPYGNRIKQAGMSNNADNAKRAMKFVKDTFKIYSSYFGFQYANGDYEIVD